MFAQIIAMLIECTTFFSELGINIAIFGFYWVDKFFDLTTKIIDFSFFESDTLNAILNWANQYQYILVTIGLFLIIITFLISVELENFAKIKKGLIGVCVSIVLLSSFTTIFDTFSRETTNAIDNLKTTVSNSQNMSLGESSASYWVTSSLCPDGQQPILEGPLEPKSEKHRISSEVFYFGGSCENAPNGIIKVPGWGTDAYVKGLTRKVVREKTSDNKYDVYNVEKFQGNPYTISFGYGIMAFFMGILMLGMFLFTLVKIAMTMMEIGIQKISAPLMMMLGSDIRNKFLLEIAKGFGSLILMMMMFFIFVGVANNIIASKPTDNNILNFFILLIYLLAFTLVVIQGDALKKIVGIDTGVSSLAGQIGLAKTMLSIPKGIVKSGSKITQGVTGVTKKIGIGATKTDNLDSSMTSGDGFSNMGNKNEKPRKFSDSENGIRTQNNNGFKDINKENPSEVAKNAVDNNEYKVKDGKFEYPNQNIKNANSKKITPNQTPSETSSNTSQVSTNSPNGEIEQNNNDMKINNSIEKEEMKSSIPNSNTKNSETYANSNINSTKTSSNENANVIPKYKNKAYKRANNGNKINRTKASQKSHFDKVKKK